MTTSLSLISVMVVLWAGVVSFASPCFLPVVPVFVGYLTGQTVQAGAAVSNRRKRWSAVSQALIFMAAFAAVFIALWSLIGLIGWVVGGARTWLRIGGGIVLVVIGLHTAGLIKIGFLDKVLQPAYSPDQTQPPNWRRSLLLGLAFGAGWTPCIGPILGAVLGLATTTNSVGQGIILMIVYSIGLGLPFVLVCAGAASVAARMKWFLAHQRGVNIVVGVFLIVVGFLMITDLFSRLAGLLPIAI